MRVASNGDVRPDFSSLTACVGVAGGAVPEVGVSIMPRKCPSKAAAGGTGLKADGGTTAALGRGTAPVPKTEAPLPESARQKGASNADVTEVQHSCRRRLRTGRRAEGQIG
eukprot:5019029-Pleurochrysis_carterae.AAC.1